MKQGFYALFVCGPTAVACASGISLNVVPSSAPNVFGSPSWAPYAANALNSLENGLGNIGNRTTDPTAYEIASPIVDPGEFMVTSFNSWRGVAYPPAPFAAELGNRMHFGLHAVGDGATLFRLEDLTFNMTSSDGPNSLGYAGNFVGLSYNGTTRYGINWGPDRVKGGGNDIVYTSGNGTTLVDEIVYVGVGNAFWPQPTGAQTPQQAIDAAIAYVNGNLPFTLQTTYTILGHDGVGTVTVIPAPGAFALALAGAGIVLRRRR